MKTRKARGIIALIFIFIYLALSVLSRFSFDIARCYFTDEPWPLSTLPTMIIASVIDNLKAHLTFLLTTLPIAVFYIIHIAENFKKDSRIFYYIAFGLTVVMYVYNSAETIIGLFDESRRYPAFSLFMIFTAIALIFTSHLLILLYFSTGHNKPALYRWGFILALINTLISTGSIMSILLNQTSPDMEFLKYYHAISAFCSLNGIFFTVARWLSIPQFKEKIIENTEGEPTHA